MRTRLRFSERIHRALSAGGRGAIREGVEKAALRIISQAEKPAKAPPSFEIAYVMRFDRPVLMALRRISEHTGESINRMVYLELEKMMAEGEICVADTENKQEK